MIDTTREHGGRLESEDDRMYTPVGDGCGFGDGNGCGSVDYREQEYEFCTGRKYRGGYSNQPPEVAID